MILSSECYRALVSTERGQQCLGWIEGSGLDIEHGQQHLQILQIEIDMICLHVKEKESSTVLGTVVFGLK